MTTKIGDSTLGLDSQSRAVLAVLSDIEAPETISTSTAAWYNGREQGFVITAQRKWSSPGLHIKVSECRNSDSITVSHWKSDVSINPPTHKDRPESAWQKEAHFSYLAIADVVEHIKGLLAKFE